LGDTSYVAGDGIFSATMTLSNIESASLTGGAGPNTFDVSQRSIPAAINGGAGVDTLFHSRDANVTLTNSQLAVSGLANTTFSLANIENATLVGGGGNNTFTIAQWAGNGTIVGGAGDDTINISQGNLDAIAGFWNILGGVGANDRIVLNDSLHALGANYLIGPNSASIARNSFRRFGAIFFDGTAETVQLSGSQAANRIDVTPSLGTVFSVDGNGPAGSFGDALVLHTAFTGGANGPFNGPGPGQKRFTFNTGHRDVIFEEIEQNVFVP
jgi:hypothetical protein